MNVHDKIAADQASDKQRRLIEQLSHTLKVASEEMISIRATERQMRRKEWSDLFASVRHMFAARRKRRSDIFDKEAVILQHRANLARALYGPYQD